MAHPQVTIMKHILSHKGYLSNCKRIAKEIEKNGLTVAISDNLLRDMNEVGRDKYFEEINNNLKGLRVRFKSLVWSGQNQLIFEEDE